MNQHSRLRAVVVGAGVLGLAAARALRQRGASVTVLDPDPGASASAAAAGMISPALEAALEEASPERAALYREAAARWRRFARDAGVELVEEGADWLGPVQPMADRLAALGFAVEAGPDRLHVPGEARLNPLQALRALSGPDAPEPLLVTGIDLEGPRPVISTGERDVEADVVVLAAGWASGRIACAPLQRLCRHITPVKGQIISLDGEGAAAVQRMTRAPDVYLLPSDIGVIAGATMEPGVADGAVEDAVVERLRRAAIAAVPELERTVVREAWAGVRGATPDGLPMAGAAGVRGVFAALAPRRNGWLLAPLVGEAVAAAVAGETPPPWAGAFRPDRFDPA